MKFRIPNLGMLTPAQRASREIEDIENMIYDEERDVAQSVHRLNYLRQRRSKLAELIEEARRAEPVQ